MSETPGAQRLASLETHLQPYFSQRTEVAAAYLFGSRAKGVETADSDIDIALLLSTDFDLHTHSMYRLERMTELESRLSAAVDVVILNQASLVLRNQVLKYGKLIYEADHRQRITFEVRSRQAYHDFQPALVYLNQALMQQIQEVGLAHRYRGHRDPLGDARRARERLKRAADHHTG